MKTSKKIILIASVIGTLGVSGLVKNAFAEPPHPQVAVVKVRHQNTQVAQASDGDGETNDANEAGEEKNEQQESSRLQSLVKITPQQARQAAETAQRGRASSVQLENENGNLVYAVRIGQREVKVDAGNGRVLYVDNANRETNEGTRPRSSIQVPRTNR